MATMSSAKIKRKRKTKSVVMQSVRITPAMDRSITQFWTALQEGTNPDLTRASAIREAIRRGIQ